jgi:hypothetical protein
LEAGGKILDGHLTSMPDQVKEIGMPLGRQSALRVKNFDGVNAGVLGWGTDT